MKRLEFLSAITAAVALCLGLSTQVNAQQATTQAAADSHEHEAMNLPTLGVAVLTPTKDNKVRGTLRLIQQGDVLRVVGKIHNLTPGEHGFHIHQFGDQRGPDGMATGGHFDPHGHEHGAPGEKSHAGDFGNITADEQGVATVNVSTQATKLHFVLGRAFVVHAGRDDLKSQPSGDAGARVATGVIGVGNPDFKPQAHQ